MARRRIQLAWIANAASRRSTLKKRRECLMRKLKEISTLTGEDACGIVLSPDEGDPPVFWPPSINEILERFFRLSDAEQSKKANTLESFMQEKISKLEEQLGKERKRARNEEINYVMHSIHSHGKPVGSLTFPETHELFCYMEELRKKCELRVSNMRDENEMAQDSLLALTQPPSSQPPPLAPQPHPMPMRTNDDPSNVAGSSTIIRPWHP